MRPRLCFNLVQLNPCQPAEANSQTHTQAMKRQAAGCCKQPKWCSSRPLQRSPTWSSSKAPEREEVLHWMARANLSCGIIDSRHRKPNPDRFDSMRRPDCNVTRGDPKKQSQLHFLQPAAFRHHDLGQLPTCFRFLPSTSRLQIRGASTSTSGPSKNCSINTVRSTPDCARGTTSRTKRFFRTAAPCKAVLSMASCALSPALSGLPPITEFSHTHLLHKSLPLPTRAGTLALGFKMLGLGWAEQP